ncbi:MAG: serine/threonine protein kinase, partial [Phycisphaerales bacterium]
MTYAPDEHDQTLLSLSSGEVLSERYQLVRELGRGGMGVVWLAEDEHLDSRPMAIKVLPSALCRNARAVARLKKEALINLELTHPHIVRLFNFEQDPQRSAVAYLVMQYVQGKTLDDLLVEYPDGLPLERVREWAEQLSQAIDHAHAKQILHRDIKPSNIIIDGDGNAYLMDFGIAREAKDTMTRVTGRESSGTLPYMSPQQLMGKNSRSNDIYSFAATLYEALCGRPPFETGDIAT